MPEQVVTTYYDLIFATGYFTDACRKWNQRPTARKTWVDFKPYFVEEHLTWQDTQPTSVGETYPSANALAEANIREADTINTIALLSLATASNRDTYANISGTVTSLVAELVLANKNLVEALKENTRLKRVLGQCQQITRSSSGAAVRGVTPQHKKGAHYCWLCGYESGHPSFKFTERQRTISCTAWRRAQREGPRRTIHNYIHMRNSILLIILIKIIRKYM